MPTDVLNNNVRIQGDLTVTGNRLPSFDRDELTLETGAVYIVPWTFHRKYAAFDTNLPGTSSGSDLALVGGSFATNTPSIQTSDLKTAGATSRYTRFVFQLPAEYQAGEAVQVRLHAGMLTHVADTTATIAVEAYKSDRERGPGSNLCATAAQSINSLTLADKTFVITATTLGPGDWLDIRLTIAVNDAAGGSAVIGCIGEVAMLLGIRG